MSPIDTHLAQFSEPERQALERIRKLVHRLAPDAAEVISYGMPGFRYKGRYLLGFNGFKDHLSLFPTAGPVEALSAQLTDYKTARGTIQFTVAHPLPDELLEAIIRYRIATI